MFSNPGVEFNFNKLQPTFSGIGLSIFALNLFCLTGCKEQPSSVDTSVGPANVSKLSPEAEAKQERQRQIENALAIIDRVGGKYQVDKSNPDLPVFSVNLASSKIKDDELLQLRCLTELKSLDLNACFEITDVGLAILRDLKKLENLNLWGCHRFSDAGFEHLAGLAEMKSMNLGYTGFDSTTGSGLRWLKDLKRLKMLGLNVLRKLEPNHLDQLAGVVDLEVLHLSCSKLDDNGLKHVAGFTNLKELDIAETQVTDAGISQLMGLTKLKRLTVGGKTLLTEAGLNELKSTIANLEVVKN